MSLSDKKKNNPHTGHRQRVRKRFLEEGGSSFEKHELLELILFGTIPMQDTNPIAHKLLNNFEDSFTVLLNSDYRDIIEKCNTSTNVAVFLKAVGEIIKRCQMEKTQEKIVMDTSEKSGKYVADLLMYETTENFYMLCLDAGNHLLKTIRISQGTHTKVQVQVEDVVKEALLSKAVSVIFAHNHPGGNLYPSNADIDLTLKLRDALKIVNVTVVDHIISSSGKYISLAEKGFLK